MAKEKKTWADLTKKEKKLFKIFAGAFIATLLLLIVASIFNSISSEEPSKPTYESYVNDTKVIDPATLSVSVAVQNNNNIEGKPNCFIEAQSQNGKYRGFDSFQMNDIIPANQKRGLVANVVITNEGAAFVTDIKADCKVAQ